jgi:hypothetical protein
MVTADSQARIQMLELLWKCNTKGGALLRLSSRCVSTLDGAISNRFFLTFRKRSGIHS